MARERGSQGAGKRRREREAKARPASARRQSVSTAEIDQLLDDIEAAVLATDAEKVQALTGRLWAARRRVPEALVERLIEGRTQLPGIAFELLSGLGGSRAPTLLRKVANSPEVPDLVRFGAHRRVGWPERGEAKARLKFFESLQDPEFTLIQALATAAAWPFPHGEVLEEVLAYLKALPSERRYAVVQRAIAEQVPKLDWVLRALLHLDDPAIQRLAIGELVRLRDPAASAALSRLAQTTRDPEIATEAAAAERRLRMRVVPPVEATAAAEEERPPMVALDRVLATLIDGDGGQMVMVVRRWDEPMSLFTSVFVKDTAGIRDAHGQSRISQDELQGLLAEFSNVPSLDPLQALLAASSEVTLVEIDLASARGILAQAAQINASTGSAIPPAFEVWEPFFHDAFPPSDDEPVVTPELDGAPYRGRSNLVRKSAQLLEHPLFLQWFFNPDEIGPLLLHVPPPKGGRMTDRQYGPLIAGLVTGEKRDLLRWRLRRQAWLLEKRGDQKERDLALAAAASLDAEPEALEKQPFLRRMIDVSLSNLLGSAIFDVV